MPFVQAAPAAGRGRVLGNECRMPAHRGLATVILPHCGRETGPDELMRMGTQGRNSPVRRVRGIAFIQPEPAAKARARQSCAEFVPCLTGEPA